MLDSGRHKTVGYALEWTMEKLEEGVCTLTMGGAEGAIRS